VREPSVGYAHVMGCIVLLCVRVESSPKEKVPKTPLKNLDSKPLYQSHTRRDLAAKEGVATMKEPEEQPQPSLNPDLHSKRWTTVY
jgi:hypothetical protein